MQKILVVDDNVELSRVINLYLAPKYHTQLVTTLAHAYRAVSCGRFDVILLDLTLPDGDGLELLGYLREQHLDLRIIVLSHKGLVADRLRGLRVGADDYLAKPFSVEELLLRIEIQLNNVYRVRQNRFEMQNVVILEKEGKVTVNQHEVLFRPKEFSILLFLLRHEGQVISRATLIENLWFEQESPTFNTIDVYIRRIRMLLGKESGIKIKTRRGFGYMLVKAQAKVPTLSPASSHPRFANTVPRVDDNTDPVIGRWAA